MSPDIIQYAQTHEHFPHDSTLDQFFDSDQFESYRADGEQIALDGFGEIVRPFLNAPPSSSGSVSE